MYDINDCLLVRKTDIFPKDGIIQTPVHGRAYEFGSSLYLGDAISDKINSLFVGLEAFSRESKKYAVYYETFRRTIHFVMNGIVQDSLYGIFDYPIAIIEPFKYHKDDSLKCLRVEDVFYSEDMKLSSEHIILVPEEKKEEYEDKYGFEGLNIRTYKESLDDAIKEVFKERKYPFFEANNHGYCDGLDNESEAYKFFKMICDYAISKGISLDRHFGSNLNYEDGLARFEKSKEIDYRHLVYLLDSGLVSSDLVDRIKAVIPFDLDNYSLKSNFKPLAAELIEQIGLENLEKLTSEFNNMMIEERKKALSVSL